MVASPAKQLPGLLTGDLVCLGALSMIPTARWARWYQASEKVSGPGQTLFRIGQGSQPRTSEECDICRTCIQCFPGTKRNQQPGLEFRASLCPLWQQVQALKFVTDSHRTPSFWTPLLPVSQVVGRPYIGLYEQS